MPSVPQAHEVCACGASCAAHTNGLRAVRIVAIVDDTGLVEATLRRMGQWQDPVPRGPPIDLHPPPVPETEREKWWDDMPGED